MKVYLLIWEVDPIGVYKTRSSAEADAKVLKLENFHVYEFVIK
jgi:hypothetical protein